MKKLIMLVCLFCPGGLLAKDAAKDTEERYLCIAEQTAGFAIDDSSGEWESTTFEAGDKYLIAPLEKQTETVHGTIGIFPFGEDTAISGCGDGYKSHLLSSLISNLLVCKGGDFESEYFWFNKKNGRFLTVYLHGFIVPNLFLTEEGEVTPFISIGKCSRI